MLLENKIDSFIGNVSLGVSFFATAGTQLVAMIDEEPDVCDRIVAMRRVDWLTRDVLDTFEAIGRKQLAVEAMFLPKHVLQRMISLPVETQAVIATEPVPVFREANSRKTDAVVLKPAAQLTRREAAVAIGPNGVRSVEEQRGVINNSAISDTPEKSVGFFELTTMNGKVFVKKVERVARAQKVKLDSRGIVVLELVV